jgi:hypothetical protein
MNSLIENIKEYFDDELKIDFTICDFSLKIKKKLKEKELNLTKKMKWTQFKF